MIHFTIDYVFMVFISTFKCFDPGISRTISSIRVMISSSRTTFNPSLTDEELHHGCRLGIDSHADMSCVGKHAHILERFTGKSCTVRPFNDSYKAMENISTVNAAFAHDTSEGQTYILEVNQSLDFSDSMEHSLLCPNQSRMHNVIVNDVPKCLDVQNISTHSVIFPSHDIELPLHMHGPVSYLPVRYPTESELDRCLHLELTDGSSDWDPHCIDNLFHVSVMSSMSSFDNSYSHLDNNLLFEDLHTELDSSVNVNALYHRKVNELTPQALASMWKIPISQAKLTLKSTTQSAIKLNEGILSRRFKPKVHHTRYKQLGGYLGMFASDIFQANVVSLRGNKYTTLFCNRGNFCRTYPMKKKSDAPHSLDRFIHEVGVPNELLTDGAKELTLGKWGATCRKKKICMQTTEPHSPWQNHAERIGGLIKRKVKALMRATNTPVRLWDYCFEYASSIRSLTASDHMLLDGVTPFEKVFGYTPDIAEFLLFDWFQWIWYHDPSDPDEVNIGRWIGPSTNSGQALASHVLTATGRVITRSTVSSISSSELASEEVKQRQKDFTESVEKAIGNYSKALNENITSNFDTKCPYDSIFDDDQFDNEHALHADSKDLRPDAEEYLSPSDSPLLESIDQHIGLSVDLPHKGEIRHGKVISRKRNNDGTLVGNSHDNPILDSRMYVIDFGEGDYAEYSANVLMENLYSQVDDDGLQYSLLDGIVDHMKLDDAVPTDSGFYTTSTGATRRVVTTKGWKLKVQWKDGSCTWIPLSELKEANPVEVAEYAASHNLSHEPAFAWWVGHTLRKRERIIKQVHHRIPKKTVKFGVRVPATLEEALQIDKINGNDFWLQAINKEIKNVKIAFELLQEGESPPPGSRKIPYHFVFDVRFDLTRKARLVAGGHRNKDIPQHSRYSSVASRDSVRIGLLIAALNNLSVASTDIGNAYLNAPPKERVHVVVGDELFGPEHKGETAVIVRALYGLKTAGNAWRHHLANFIRDELHYVDTKADPDVYRRPELSPDGKKYYSYLIVYVDDVLCIHHHPKSVLDVVSGTFRLKNGIDEDPSTYLGADIRKWSYINEDGKEDVCWAMGSQNYVKEAMRICEAQMAAHQLSYPTSKRQSKNTPFTRSDYRPELDPTPYCSSDKANLYQQLIGILRWICELGRIDILHEVSLLSQYLAQPRFGHLMQTLNIFYYLKTHQRSWMVMEPTRFGIDWVPTSNEPSPEDRASAMKEIYADASDELPHDMPEPRGEMIDISIFVDADHAGNKVTRRSHTGIIIYCNLAPIIWYSKRQNTVETSTFGSEFIALKIATELNDSLRYKLRMFGVPISGPSRVMCDNDSVVKSSSFAESTLKKKHCSIAFHKVRESVASEKILIYYEKSSSNLADLLTKVMNAAKRHPLIQGILS